MDAFEPQAVSSEHALDGLDFVGAGLVVRSPSKAVLASDRWASVVQAVLAPQSCATASRSVVPAVRLMGASLSGSGLAAGGCSAGAASSDALFALEPASRSDTVDVCRKIASAAESAKGTPLGFC